MFSSQLDFFEVSEFSFVWGTRKWKEGFVRRRVGDDVGETRHDDLAKVIYKCK